MTSPDVSGLFWDVCLVTLVASSETISDTGSVPPSSRFLASSVLMSFERQLLLKQGTVTTSWSVLSLYGRKQSNSSDRFATRRLFQDVIMFLTENTLNFL